MALVKRYLREISPRSEGAQTGITVQGLPLAACLRSLNPGSRFIWVLVYLLHIETLQCCLGDFMYH